jgi:hypothetical protein
VKKEGSERKVWEVSTQRSAQEKGRR